MTFHIPHAGLLHGLAGYFEAHLYANVGLSIHPENMDRVSPDMFSWFPLFFPFKEPLFLPSGAELDVGIWRLTDKDKVWYEWCAEAFLPTDDAVAATANSMGRSPSGSGQPSAGGGPAAIASPYADAPFSPIYPTHGNPYASGGRVKIGQTRLHNPGGAASFVGL